MPYEHLTVEQREVVLTTDRHLVVLAGPGSGKTHVIIERILYLFATDMIPEPYGLLAITFTNAAANEMRSRLRTKGFTQWDRILISTFHSFGNYLLRCYGSDVGVREDFEIISRDDQAELCIQAIQSAGLNGMRPGDLLRNFENLKRRGIYPDQQDNGLATGLRNVYTHYQQNLTDRNLLDFGDLVALAVKLLRESALPKKLFTNFFHYVIVDEFQDTDIQQLDLTHLLAETAAVGGLMVADDDQSIYRFRGANRANVYEIEGRLGARRIILGANFRSDQVIVEAAQAVINREKNRPHKPITITSPGRGHIFKADFATPEAEAGQIATWINTLKETGKIEDWGQIAVITRDRWRAEQILAALNAIPIPWFDRARLNFQDSWETNLGLAILMLAINPNSTEGLHRVLTAVEDGGLAFVMRDDDAYDTALKIRQQLIQNEPVAPVPTNATQILEFAGIHNIIRNYSWSVTEARRLTENLEVMTTDIIREADTLGLDMLQIINRLAGYGAVQVMSGHGSKGKEFNYVFIVGLEDDVLPNRRAHTNPEDINEERRIFYVSLTRAKKAAYLTHAQQRVAPWGDVQTTRPSRFIEHIPAELFDPLP